MLLPQRPKEYDYFFIKNLMTVTDDKELKEIISLLEREDEKITAPEREKIELFMLRVKDKFGSWKDSVYGLYQNYNVDIYKMVTSSKVLSEKLGVEHKPSITHDVSEMMG